MVTVYSFLSTLLYVFYNPGILTSIKSFKGNRNLYLFFNIRTNDFTLYFSMIFSLVNIFNNFTLSHRFGE